MGKPKSQASSSRVAIGSLGGASTNFGSFGGFFQSTSSLSYLAEIPDTATLSNSSVIVLFKNLFKKDSSTKSKALQGLSEFLSAQTEVEDAFLEIWFVIYPKTSIENDKEIRKLAHQVQGQVCVLAGRRIVKYLPSIIGPWLLGTHESDKLVAEKAQSALQQTFPSLEKQKLLLEKCQPQAFRTCQLAIESETSDTLSDQRFVSPDEAELKYNRVIASSLTLISHILTSLEKLEDSSKLLDEYKILIKSSKFWSLISSKDSSVRRQFHRLIASLISNSKARDLLDSSTLCSKYISKGLGSDQSTAVISFLDTLIAISSTRNTIWTSEWTDKKQPLSKLCVFLEKGSQSSLPEQFWTRIAHFIKLLPHDVYNSSSSDIKKILDSLHTGVNQKDELKLSICQGIGAYIVTVRKLSEVLDPEGSKKIQFESITPIIKSIMMSDTKFWSIPVEHAIPILGLVSNLTYGEDIILNSLEIMSQFLIKSGKDALPEQSSDYQTSQNNLIATSNVWGTILKKCLELYNLKVTHVIINTISETTEVIQSRKGKPYGVTQVIYDTIYISQSYLVESKEFTQTCDKLLSEVIPTIFVSPSMKIASMILESFNENEMFIEAWESCLRNVISLPQIHPSKVDGTNFLIQILPDKPILGNSISALVIDDISDGPVELFPVLFDIIPHLQNQDQISQVTEILANKLDPSRQDTDTILTLLGCLTEPRLKIAVESNNSNKIWAQILLLTESKDNPLNSKSNDTFDQMRKLCQDRNDLYVVLRKAIVSAEKPLALQTIANVARDLINYNQATPRDLLLDVEEYESAMQYALNSLPLKSLFLSSRLPTGIFLIDDLQRKQPEPSIHFDSEGNSIALRISLYTLSIFEAMEKNSMEFETAIFAPTLSYLLLAILIASDNMQSGQKLMSLRNEENLVKLADDGLTFISNIITGINDVLVDMDEYSTNTTNKNVHGVVIGALNMLYANIRGNSGLSYWSGLAFSYIRRRINQLDGISPPILEMLNIELPTIRKESKSNPMKVVSFLTANQEAISRNPSMNRWYNEMVANLSGSDVQSNAVLTRTNLVLLYTMIKEQPTEFLNSAANPRLVTFAKSLTNFLSSTNVTNESLILSIAILRKVLPLLLELYDGIWETVISSIREIWAQAIASWNVVKNNDIYMPLFAESIRLIDSLGRLTKEENCNDDLTELLETQSPRLRQSLLEMAILEPDVSAKFLPKKYLDGFICQSLMKWGLSKLDAETEQLYPLLNRDSEDIQSLAHAIIRNKVQNQTNDLAIEAALNGGKIVSLPEQLLSLVVEAPPCDVDDFNKWVGSVSDINFDEEIPWRLRGYLLAWDLIYVHFSFSTATLENHYSSCLNDGNYHKGLLNFIFQFNGHGDGQIKTKLQKFDFTGQLPPRDELEGFLWHLYYLSLLHTSSLVKGWWLEISSRLFSQQVETLTTKHMSPHIILVELNKVEEWAKTQQENTSDDSKPLTIKINRNTNEIGVCYTIDSVDHDDPYTVCITVVLPKSFPFQGAVVGSKSEKVTTFKDGRWKSWQISAQRYMSFSNNNVIDGLLAWKRNIEGALQGKSDCYICYSLVAEDGKLPSKTCKTCKHAFHYLCLGKWFQSSNGTTCPLCRTQFYNDSRRRGNNVSE